MRIDVISIFPEYFSPLDLSLIGKARQSNLLDVHVHDLRTWTFDNHHTVDDTPYGGGAGMVMMPEPIGDAIDAILKLGSESNPDSKATLFVTTPAGVRLDQKMANQISARDWIIILCGRYEGIDQRVVDHYLTRPEVDEVVEVSIGDYVLNGGEVAALVLIEAVGRLLPGVIGNPHSLTEESHAIPGQVEAPLYTKPAQWRGLPVPEVLLSGHHGKIEQWRSQQAKSRGERG